VQRSSVLTLTHSNTIAQRRPPLIAPEPPEEVKPSTLTTCEAGLCDEAESETEVNGECSAEATAGCACVCVYGPQWHGL